MGPGTHVETGSVVRGRCACGRRYRIRNATAGVHVQCPACKRAIAVTDADLRNTGDLQLAPLQDDSPVLLDAVPLESAVVTTAPAGSKPGFNGRVVHDSPEAKLALAFGGRVPTTQPRPDWLPAALGAGLRSDRGRYISDLLATFYLAGYKSNLVNLLVTAFTCAILSAFALLPSFGPFGIIFLVPYVLMILGVLQFYCMVLRESAAGQHELAWISSDWDLVDDAVVPMLTMIGAAIFCTLPALLLVWFAPPAVAKLPGVYWGTFAAGWFLWPAVMMAVLLGGGISCARPDLLLRAVAACGIMYPIMWLLLLGVLFAWGVTRDLARDYRGASLILPLINLYFGYVFFRVLGLTYYHNRARLPW